MRRGPAIPPGTTVKAAPAAATSAAQPKTEEQRIVSVLRGLRGLQEKVRKLRRDGSC